MVELRTTMEFSNQIDKLIQSKEDTWIQQTEKTLQNLSEQLAVFNTHCQETS